ncbi:MAG TPA: thiamine phosphate synthase [Caulobacteraceae bacterium]|nr:thiamine phosphate synthase [Caulobacteraceae bacterium]
MRLWKGACHLGRRARAGKGLPPLLLFTDPDRTPDPAAAMDRLPRGAGVVFRPFGRPDQLARGPALRAVARRRGLVFLVGADARLAATLKADGVHLPERLAHRAGPLRRLRPGWVVTAAAHGLAAALAARRAGAQAVVVSAVFPSRSASAGRPMGATRFAALARSAGLPVYALGGVNAGNVRRLAASGAAGVAAVDGV